MSAQSARVPFHLLGLSQIISYGLLFYIFAQLKTPLALAIGVAESQVLAAVSGALIIQALLAPIIGGWSDRFGALWVMTRGLALGAVGLAMLPLNASLWWLWLCMVPIGTGFAMSSYELAFNSAVQLDEANARRNISFITFYGGVASSVTWLSVAPLLVYCGLSITCFIVAGILAITAVRFFFLHRVHGGGTAGKGQTPASFSWQVLSRSERLALVMLGSAGGLEYLVFASTTLLWINWFQIRFNDPALAVMLAALYGPFQVVGRVIEMRFGHRFDARITGMIAFMCGPIAMLLVQADSLGLAIAAMMIFGMGHGVLTVSFGYVTNMYFRADVYGRAKGWMTTPRAIGTAIGPSVGGMLFAHGTGLFFSVMIGILLAAALSFAALFLARTRPGLSSRHE